MCSVRSAGISFLPRMARMDTDCYGALFSHRIHRIHRIWQRGYGRDAIPSYICAHPCHLWEALLCKRFCEFRAFCGNIFSPTDFTDLHRYLGCAVLPQNSQNSQNLSAWVWQGCHTLLICVHLWETLLCQKVLCVPCVLWEYLFSHGFHRFTQMLRVRFVPTEFTESTEFVSVGMAGMPYPPTSVSIRAICGRLSQQSASVSSACSVGGQRSSNLL